MPRYFFETDDGDVFDHDPMGIELADEDDARTAAVAALADMARDKVSDGDRRTFVTIVRDESGAIIYSAVMNLVGTRHVAKVASLRTT